MLGRSAECQAVLKRHGLDHCSLAVIGADRSPGSLQWQVMVAGDVGRTEHLDVGLASKLADDLRRIGEVMLAERLDLAVRSAKRQMRPKE